MAEKGNFCYTVSRTQQGGAVCRSSTKIPGPGREVYDFFAGMSHPFYALTFPVDVTPLRAWCRERGLSFYMAMVYGVTKAMERVDAFLYKDRGGQIVRVDRLVPSFTDLHPDSGQFHIVTLERGRTWRPSAGRPRPARPPRRLSSPPRAPGAPDELVYFSCLPWFPLTAVTNERDTDPADSIPRVTWGRWEERRDAPSCPSAWN